MSAIEPIEPRLQCRQLHSPIVGRSGSPHMFLMHQFTCPHPGHGPPQLSASMLSPGPMVCQTIRLPRRAVMQYSSRVDMTVLSLSTLVTIVVRTGNSLWPFSIVAENVMLAASISSVLTIVQSPKRVQLQHWQNWCQRRDIAGPACKVLVLWLSHEN